MPATATYTLDALAGRMTDAARDASKPLDLTPAMKVCSMMVASDAKLNIEGGHSPDGTPYLPLKHARANSKGGDKPLRDKGPLLASVSGGAGWITSVGPQSMSAGTNLSYAAIHNFGGSISFPEKRRPSSAKPWVFPGPGGHPIFTRRIRAHTVTIPQRQFLGFSEQLLADCAEAIGDHAGRMLAGGMI